jgi:L-fuconolactonase
MRIDAHQHFWQMSQAGRDWPTADLSAIYRDFQPDGLAPLLKSAELDGTVLVQTMERLSETDYMLSLADQHDFILGVVGWVDMKAPHAAANIDQFSQHLKFSGIRPMLQDMEDSNWIDDEALSPAVDALIRNGKTFDALVRPRQLKALYRFASRHAGLPIVIDHVAKPIIAEGLYSHWRSDMAQLNSLSNVYCKLSGMWTECGAQRPEAIRPYAETILELFGPSRVLWGSDWPVLNLAGSYLDWHAYCREIVPAADHDLIFGANAARFYSLKH